MNDTVKPAKEKWFINKLNDTITIIGFKRLNLFPRTLDFLLTLAKYADKNGCCWPSEVQIENQCGIHRTNQHRHIKILKQKGFITVKRKYDRRMCMTRNYYTVHLNALLTISMGINGDLRVDGVAVNPVIMPPEVPCTNTEPNVMVTDDRNVMVTVATIKTTQTTELPNLINGQISKKSNFEGDEMIELPLSVFDRFWAVYPRKQHRLRAMKVWQSKKLDSKGEVIIKDILSRQENDVQWRNKEYIPHASTYLNGECWNDEIIGDQNEKAKTDNRIHKRTKTEESIIRGFKDYEESRKRSGR